MSKPACAASKRRGAPLGMPLGAADAVLNALPLPVIMVARRRQDRRRQRRGRSLLRGFGAACCAASTLRELVPFGSPLLSLVDQVRDARRRGQRIPGRSRRRRAIRGERLVDLYVAPLPERPDQVVVMLQERTMADKMDRQLTHRGAARSVSALAAMLAHEIKNPLSGIRGAAQLLEQSAGDEDRALTRLICDETDRIVKLVDRMEVFSDERPIEREPVNIHVVLDHVKRLAQSASRATSSSSRTTTRRCRRCSPTATSSIQVFLNLVKNAAEAIGDDAPTARSS